MKKSLIASSFILLGLTYTIPAYAGFYGEFAFMTNYIWRGVSQSDNAPADYWDLGYGYKDFSAGATADNVSYGEDDPAFLELGPYLAYSHEFASEIQLNLSVNRYVYPDAHFYDYNQYNSSVSYKFATLGLEYANNYFNEGISDTYPYLGLNFDLPKGFMLGGHVGYSSKAKNDLDDEGSYLDYEVDVSHDIFGGVNAKLAYTNTVYRALGDGIAGSNIVFSLSKSFGDA